MTVPTLRERRSRFTERRAALLMSITVESERHASTQAQPTLPKALRHMINPENDTPEQLRADLLAHFSTLGLTNLTEEVGKNGIIRPEGLTLDKDGIRKAHKQQRESYMEHEARMSGRYWSSALSYFADGNKIEPAKIKPTLVRVTSETFESELFRFATTLWSVPVSRGFGRRMRYLVMDEHHQKLIGIFALGDPVFNLRARDLLVGWDQAARRQRLVNVMDGYIIGSMPPYSALLGGKLVTSLIGSHEVSQDFRTKYGNTTGIISGAEKDARLALVTVTSALGRSSVYNRLHLKQPGTKNTLLRLESIGMTDGYGHFHLSEDLFSRMRFMLLKQGHPYALGHQFGDGPNWRMRMIRVALAELGLSTHLTRHGISREVFAMPLIKNYKKVLREGTSIWGSHRPSVVEISDAALEQWILPRASTKPEYRTLRHVDYLKEQIERIPPREKHR